MTGIETIKNRVILFNHNLYVVDDVRLNEGIILMSKLESDAEIIQVDFDAYIDFDFEEARLSAVEIMNQTRYFDNALVKEKDNNVL